MKKTILLTSNQYAPHLIDFLMQQHRLIKVFVGEEAAVLQGYFKQLFPTLEVEVFSEQKLKLLMDSEVHLIVFGFSHIIKKSTYSQGQLACNIHFGRLPEEKGPDPLFWAIKNGKESIVATVHRLSEEVDGGDVLCEKEFPIRKEENHGMVYSRLSALMPEIMAPLLQGLYAERVQDLKASHYEARPEEKDLRINWSEMEAIVVENLVRACNAKYGGALAFLNGAMVRIAEVSVLSSVSFPPVDVPGKVVEISEEKGLVVSCAGQSFVRINAVSLNEGIFSGGRLRAFGVDESVVFG